MRVAELLAIDLDKVLRCRGGSATYVDSRFGEWVCVRPCGGTFEHRERPEEAATTLSRLCPDGADYAKLLRQESGAEEA